jgi:protoporphyrin/coproporphyrin ferrochelatase
VRDLAVACPAFVADNLETLEEIGLQGRQTFLDAGGRSFTLVPCLNDRADWIAALAGWCREALHQPKTPA